MDLNCSIRLIITMMILSRIQGDPTSYSQDSKAQQAGEHKKSKF